MPAVSTAPSSRSFDISQLPSLQKGMSAEEESMKRRKTCRFIEEAGRVLKLPRVAISTAMVFFHRFYAKHAFQEHDRFEVAVAALVLAAKTEEAPKKLNTVIQECYKLKARAMQAGRLSQQRLSPKDSASNTNNDLSYLDSKGEEFLKLKERILLLERIILHTIGFELSIDHPYKFFVEQIKKLIDTRQLQYNPKKAAELTTNQHKTNKEITSKMMNELVQYCMSTANDSYQTSLCLQFGPKQIATACVYLACMLSDVEPQNGDWKKTLLPPSSSSGPTGGANKHDDEEDENMDALVSVCIQIIDLIAEKKASDTESVRKIRKALDLLKSRDSEGNKSPRPPPPPPSGESASKRPRV